MFKIKGKKGKKDKPVDMLRVSILKNPFKIERLDIQTERQSIRRIIKETGFNLKEVDVLVIDKDIKIPEKDWNKPPESDHLILRAIPKDEVAMVVTGILSVIVGVVLLFTPAAALGGLLIGTGIGLVVGGAVLMNIEIPNINTDRQQEVLPSIRGSRNRTRQGESLPIILGKHLMTPDNAALPYTSVSGDNQYLNQLFCFGYANIEVDATTLKIGDTKLSKFSSVSYELQYGESAQNTYYSARCIETSVQQKVTQASGGIIRTTPNNTRKINVIINFPQGLCSYDDEGNRGSRGVQYLIQYSEVDAGSWSTIYSGILTKTAAKSVRIEHTITLDNLTSGDADYNADRAYDVRVQRVTADTSDVSIVDEFHWDSLKSFTGVFDGVGGFDSDPIVPSVKQNISLMGIQIKATDQLSGVIDQLNVEAHGLYADWNGMGSGSAYWIADQETRNPAALFLYVLQSSDINPEPVVDAKINWASLETWWTFCDTKGFECNAVSMGEITIEDLLNRICSVGRASWSLIDGKYSIVVDDTRSVVVQHFTPRNTWGFQGTKSFAKKPVTVKVQYVDASLGYEPVERLVSYNTGTGLIEYDTDLSSGEDEIQEVSTFGVTDADHAAKIGAYKLAVVWLRQEVYMFNVDFEYLICTRGDRVQLTHDVPLFGLNFGRIVTVSESGGNTLGFTSDEEILFEVGSTYGVTVRKQDGSSLTAELTNPATIEDVITKTLTFASPVAGTGLLAKDDLFQFGYSGSETRDLIIIEISPGENLTAKLTCVDYASGIFTADSGSIPAFDPGISKYNSSGANTTYNPVGDAPNPGSTVADSVNKAAEVAGKAISSSFYSSVPGGGSPTTTPTVPTLTGNGIFRGFSLEWDTQENLKNPYQVELQVSDDDATWYSLGFGTAADTDWRDTLDEVTAVLAPIDTYIHAPTPFVIQQDGNGDDYSSGRTLYYRARRRTLNDDVSSWSTSVPLTSKTVEDGELGYNVINANNLKASVLQAQIANISSFITISSDGYTGVTTDGDERARLDKNELDIQRYISGAWRDLIKIGGDTTQRFIQALAFGALEAFDSGIADLGHTYPDTASSVFYQFEDNLTYEGEGSTTFIVISGGPTTYVAGGFFDKGFAGSGSPHAGLYNASVTDIVSGAVTVGFWFSPKYPGVVFKFQRNTSSSLTVGSEKLVASNADVNVGDFYPASTTIYGKQLAGEDGSNRYYYLYNGVYDVLLTCSKTYGTGTITTQLSSSSKIVNDVVVCSLTRALSVTDGYMQVTTLDFNGSGTSTDATHINLSDDSLIISTFGSSQTFTGLSLYYIGDDSSKHYFAGTAVWTDPTNKSLVSLMVELDPSDDSVSVVYCEEIETEIDPTSAFRLSDYTQPWKYTQISNQVTYSDNLIFPLSFYDGSDATHRYVYLFDFDFDVVNKTLTYNGNTRPSAFSNTYDRHLSMTREDDNIYVSVIGDTGGTKTFLAYRLYYDRATDSFIKFVDATVLSSPSDPKNDALPVGALLPDYGYYVPYTDDSGNPDLEVLELYIDKTGTPVSNTIDSDATYTEASSMSVLEMGDNFLISLHYRLWFGLYGTYAFHIQRHRQFAAIVFTGTGYKFRVVSDSEAIDSETSELTMNSVTGWDYVALSGTDRVFNLVVNLYSAALNWSTLTAMASGSDISTGIFTKGGILDELLYADAYEYTTTVLKKHAELRAAWGGAIDAETDVVIQPQSGGKIWLAGEVSLTGNLNVGTSVLASKIVDRLVAMTSYTGNGVLTSKGDIWTWGQILGTYQGLLRGDINASGFKGPGPMPKPPGETGEIQDAVMYGHNGCILYTSGNLYMSGYNNLGQLGFGDTTHRSYPELLDTNVTEIWAPIHLSYLHDNTRVFYKKTDGYVYVFGAGDYGSHGLGSTSTQTTPTAVPGFAADSISRVWNFGATYGCSIIEKTDGTIWAAGYNGHGRFGNGSTTATNSTHIDISSYWLNAGDVVIDIFSESGYFDTGAQSHSSMWMLIEDSSGDRYIRAAGNNAWGQLGDASTTQRTSPITVSLSTSIASMKVGGGGPATVYVLLNSGILYAWGFNSFGAVGDGSTTHRTSPYLTNSNVRDFWYPAWAHTYSYRGAAFCQKEDGSYWAVGFSGGYATALNTTTDLTSWTQVPFNYEKYGNVEDVSRNGYDSGGAYYTHLTASGNVLVNGYNGRYGISLEGSTNTKPMLELFPVNFQS